ncbi:MAG TPA: envelope stress response membrane protein PspB [Aeromonadales bacterium]|nr:envelope stress response membrane protein PspB [Aeromonadales bacterium]
MESNIFFVPLILFMLFVAPVWVVMHYRTLGKKQGGLTEDEHQKIAELEALAEKMEDRIRTLESILDAETPDWRKRYE